MPFSHWCRVITPNRRLELEYATLLAQERYEPFSLAMTLGRFRSSQALQDLGTCLRQGGFVEYGSDGFLYLHTLKHPLTYLDANSHSSQLSVEDVNSRVHIPSEIRRAELQAMDALQQEKITSHVSGLLRPQIIQDAFKSVTNTSGDGEQRCAFAMFMGARDYLTFIAETRFETTDKFPLLRKGIQGTYDGVSVVLSHNHPGQIMVVADDGATAIINCD